jgi:hypothetical protein
LGIIQVAARLLWANPGRLIVLVAGAVSVALATSGIVLASSTSVAIVYETVDAGWRGTYDLLVRPADAPALSVGGRAVVPLDYLGLRTSGITRGQWQRIEGLANVDVAAPVAALGWLKNAAPGVGVEIEDPRPGVAFYVDAVATIAGEEALHATGLLAFRDERQEEDVGFRDYGGPSPVYLGMGDLPATWGLVVGLDPAAEDALVGLSDYVQGQYLSTGTSTVFDPAYNRTAVAIPVLTAARAPIPGELSVKISTLTGVTPDQVRQVYEASTHFDATPFGREWRQMLNDAINPLVENAQPVSVIGDKAPLSELLHPLIQHGVIFGPDGHLSATSSNLGGGSGVDDNVLLVPSLAGYSVADSGPTDLALSALGSWQDVMDPRLEIGNPEGWSRPESTFGGDATVYRDLEVTVPPAFSLSPIGTYDRDALDAHFGSAANDAPLGIYSTVPRTLVEDSSGELVNQPLPVSINPGGLNPQPPIGLTNLEAVESVRGDHFIDAIRVRVAGVSGYTPEAVRRIETVAQQIVETTGLRVDVMAGSSPIDLSVAVAGVGVMSERWTTIGAAADIVSGAEGLSGGLLAAALVVVVAYLAAFGVLLTGDQAAEMRILRRLGWRSRALVGLVATQAVALGILAAAMTAGLIALLAATGGQRVEPWMLVGAPLAVLAAHPAAAGIAGFAQLGRREQGSPARGQRRLPVNGRLFRLSLNFAAEAPGRAVTAAVATALALTVAGLVAAIELAAGGELRTTLFGSVIAVRIASYHVLAAAAALFAAGALILDSALLTVERRLSLIGVLRAVGWRARAIRRLVTLETGLPAVIAGVVAAILIGGAAVWLNLGPLALPLAVGVLAVAVVLAVVATQLPAGIAVRTAPAATLRAEGASGIVAAFAPRQALLTVTALVVTVGLAAAGLSAAEGAASKPLPFVPPTVHPLSPVAAQIRTDVGALVANPDRAPGSASFGLALGYVADELSSASYEVSTDDYLSSQAEYFDSSGQPIDIAGISSPALAYDAAAWDGKEIDAKVDLVDATNGSPAAGCPDGVVVLRIAEYGQVSSADELQQRCLGQTSAVLAVRATSDGAWAEMTARVSRVRLPAASFLTAASHDLSPQPGAPWLVVSLDSSGPGATQSAAPTAVMLAIARQAAAQGIPLRMGVVATSDQAAGSVFLERLASEERGPIVWLGPMGGLVAPVLGTATITGLDPDAATAGLLWIAPVDSAFDQWLTRVSAPSGQPTSGDLLRILSQVTGIAPTDEANPYAGPLTAGLDAAWLGEPALTTIGPPSIAGTPADTADQIHPNDLEQLATAVLAALPEIGR